MRQNNTNLRSVALPVEHGGWIFLIEPILLGLLVAPSLAGLWLGLAAVGVFLTYHPLQMVIKDRLKGKYFARTRWAERFVILYGLVAVSGLTLALLSAQATFWPMILLAAPLALIQIFYRATNRGRAVGAELCGAMALTASAPAIALAAGWSAPNALILWAILAVQAVTSILYVRARLRVERSEPVNVRPALLAHGIGLICIVGLAVVRLVPWLTILALGILTVRALMGLVVPHQPVRARTVGFQEMGYSLLTMLLVIWGYR